MITKGTLLELIAELREDYYALDVRLDRVEAKLADAEPKPKRGRGRPKKNA